MKKMLTVGAVVAVVLCMGGTAFAMGTGNNCGTQNRGENCEYSESCIGNNYVDEDEDGICDHAETRQETQQEIQKEASQDAQQQTRQQAQQQTRQHRQNNGTCRNR